ncbi:MAG: YbjQ family protein [Candidatus Omnitrophota bacterium]
MITTNIDLVPGKKIIEHFGIVQGSTVRARHAGADFAAGLKNIVGGELRGYTSLLEGARREALERMVKQAEQLGANAVINIRFATSAITQGAAELMAYGTAVRVE